MRRLNDTLARPAGAAARGLLLLCLLLLSNAAWSEIYRWVDENGQVHFSDRVPPPVSKLERHVLDQRGNLREVLHRQRTVEELTQHRERLAAMKTEAERRARQEQYDRYLWTTFDGIEELEALRDERIEIRDNQIVRLKEEQASIERALATERERRTASVIAQQNLIRSLEADLEHVKATIREMEAQRREEFQGLSQDMKRYEYLRLQRSMFGDN